MSEIKSNNKDAVIEFLWLTWYNDILWNRGLLSRGEYLIMKRKIIQRLHSSNRAKNKGCKSGQQ